MHSLKKILLIAFLAITNLSFAQSFTFSGPTGNITIPFGQTEYRATYYFTYYDIGGLFMPKLLVFLDGNLLTEGMCEGATPFTPSSYCQGPLYSPP